MRTLSPFHYIVFSPVLFLDKKQNSYYKKINNSVGNDAGSFAPLSFYNNQPAALPVPWDTMLQKGRDSVLARATNNSMGINNEYYNAHIKGKNGRIKAVDFEHNTELKDFRMLMKLIRAYEVDAYFVMQPLNPHYYTNLKDLNPVIDEVRKEIKGGRGERAYDCADFFVTDTARYDKALLTDVMHFSEYGWHLVNRAVMNHYALK
ncbi:MAG: hypothetical protein BWY70_00972 [Bacteroidetes bacterium ADurb.Bin408]|nr:MAG: hypothetical protein BWY70_00972 [Bacteroidetes bacterium ADurb.Bin408]